MDSTFSKLAWQFTQTFLSWLGLRQTKIEELHVQKTNYHSFCFSHIIIKDILLLMLRGMSE